MGRPSLYTPDSKPHLKMIEGKWYCYGDIGLMGEGNSPEASYSAWVDWSIRMEASKALLDACRSIRQHKRSWWSKFKDALTTAGFSVWA